MERRPLGASGIEVSVVGLGCNNFGNRLGLEATRRVVDAALDLGVTFLDTADIYGDLGGSERLLGEVLEGRRDRVVLATKFGHDMGDGEVARGSRTYMRRAVEASLGRLRTDRIDLLYYHRPDGVTPSPRPSAQWRSLSARARRARSVAQISTPRSSAR